MAAVAAGSCVLPPVPGGQRFRPGHAKARVSVLGQPLPQREDIQCVPCGGYSCALAPSFSMRVTQTYRSVMKERDEEMELPSSAMAIAAAAASVSAAPFDFVTKIGEPRRLVSAPSAEFLELCSEQLSLCEKIVGPETNLTVYVRTAESYPSGQLEFFLAAGFPTSSWNMGVYKEVLLLVDRSESEGAIGLVESALVSRGAVELPESSALVLPLVKDLFLVGLLVAERRGVKVSLRRNKPGRLKPMRPSWPPKDAGSNQANQVRISKLENVDVERPAFGTFTKEQQEETAKVARILALACVMDQRAVLLKQSSWQKGVRIDHLLEQVRGPLMAVRTLGKMLLPHLKRGEISRDVVEGILVQGDRMSDVVQQIQKSGADFIQYDDIFLKDFKEQRVKPNGEVSLEDLMPLLGESDSQVDKVSMEGQSNGRRSSSFSALPVVPKDKESPLALAVLPHDEMRQCNVSEILYQLVRAGSSLAQQKNQTLQLNTNSGDLPLMAAVDEQALRHALSNLLEYSIQHTPAAGWIRADARRAPGGGVLVIIEDNGPDMGRVVQEWLLGPLATAVRGFRDGNNTNDRLFQAGSNLIAAREALEKFGAVLNIRSPYLVDMPVGAGGTRVEIWLPTRAADAHLHTDVSDSHQ